ncbi:MAG TPA: nucleoside triphosphate pyrophosphohydrolase [Actinomycetes bacterium]|nr:nucleoside triphosphate pyrophosphohydrolase [Actinomycetes bacterium]
MTDSPGALFDRLVDIMTRLRGPGGCPWDREQTRTTLKGCLIEEAYEVVEALESGDHRHLQEELGDLLFQVVFHAQIAAEQDEFDIAGVLRGLTAKMVRRHPHVFGDASVASAREALAQWEAVKQREALSQGHRRSVIDGVPRALPALLRAQRVQAKAARIRFDWPDAAAAWLKVQEEVREADAALGTGDREHLTEELGDVLFSLVNVARLSEIDAEEALGRAIDKFRRRFTEMEATLAARGQALDTVSPEELERAWDAAKAQERRRAQGPESA